MVVATREGKLVSLELGDGDITETAHVTLPADAACVDATPIGGDPNRASLAAVGTWGREVHLFALPKLEQVSTAFLNLKLWIG